MKKTLAEIYENLYKQDKINEAVLDVKFDNPPDQKTIRMSDVYARQILGYAGRLTFNIEEYVLNWVKKAGWAKQAQEFLVPAIIRALTESYDLNDFDNIKNLINAIKDLTENKENLTSFIDTLIPENDNLLVFFSQTLSTIPSAKIFNNKDFIDKIIKFEFSEGKVAVGPGEVFITLFSEVVNPQIGDLYIPGVEKHVELKSDGGRAGKKNVIQAALNTFKEIRKNIGSTLESYKKDRLDQLFDMVEPFRDIINQKNIIFNRLLRLLLNKDYNILNEKILSQPASLRDAGIRAEKVYSLELDDPELPSKIIRELINIGQLKEGGETVDFRTYFNITPEEQAIDMLRNFSPSRNPNIKNIIKRHYNNLTPEQIVVSLQINDYQHESSEKFDYIVYFNQNNKKMVVIGPFTTNYEFNLEMVLSVADKFKPSISTGGGYGGGQIYI